MYLKKLVYISQCFFIHQGCEPINVCSLGDKSTKEQQFATGWTSKRHLYAGSDNIDWGNMRTLSIKKTD